MEQVGLCSPEKKQQAVETRILDFVLIAIGSDSDEEEEGGDGKKQ